MGISSLLLRENSTFDPHHFGGGLPNQLRTVLSQETQDALSGLPNFNDLLQLNSMALTAAERAFGDVCQRTDTACHPIRSKPRRNV